MSTCRRDRYPGTHRNLEGTEQILEVGYRWLPGTGEKIEYRVSARKKIVFQISRPLLTSFKFSGSAKNKKYK